MKVIPSCDVFFFSEIKFIFPFDVSVFRLLNAHLMFDT
jgi:hypothetical protein